MDQYNNKVDGEIWAPLRANDWIDKVQIGTPKDGSQKPGVTTSGLAFLPLKSWSEWGIALADGTIGEVLYESEGEARQELQYQRSWLAKLAVPEEYWPVLMERHVETLAGSWRILGV